MAANMKTISTRSSELIRESNYQRTVEFLIELELCKSNGAQPMQAVRFTTDVILSADFDKACAILVEYVRIRSTYNTDGMDSLGYYVHEFASKFKFSDSIIEKLEEVCVNPEYMQLLRSLN